MAKFGITINDCTDDQQIEREFKDFSTVDSFVDWLGDKYDLTPIHYNLLFERFLNEGRLPQKTILENGDIVVTGSLPDIDTDWEGQGRERIKEYLENKYGKDYVTSIGTYGTFKLKNSIKDLAREKGINSSTMNYITNFFPEPGQQQPQYLYELFHQSVDLTRDRGRQLYSFIQTYPQVVSELPLILNQPKNSSIHAAGVVIVPREFGTLYEQLPVKKHNGILVSEWEGVYIDKAGFVKFDILGVNQFDKFNHINRLIKQDTGRDIRYKDIGLTDEKVFELFRKGYNEDVFQLGGTGLKGYCKLLQPENIEDLIATVALYRPGPIESNAHLKYVKRKNGEEEVVADPGCSEITKTTYGLIIYQEQTMKICQEVGGFSLVEADDIRKALGKMKFEIIQPYKTTFLERSTKKGYRQRRSAGV
jgi:DNA polymerase-3 subunit alpha